ncbi:MAG: SpoIIE family protein phosphatase [Candidatus Rifleibacteriota bacterium]
MYRLWLLKWLARIAYGVMLPAYLLFFSLNSHYEVERERQRLALLEEMNHRLDRPASYFSDDKFFHGLLQENFSRAARSDDPELAAKKLIGRLKKRFNHSLKFILADADGKIDREFTDETRFFYVINTFLGIVGDLTRRRNSGEQVVPDADPVVVEKMSLLRSYFGQFLMEKHLCLPLKSGYLGSCLRANQEPDKGLLWYQKYSSFSVIAFVGRSLLGQNLGLKLISSQINRQQRRVVSGFYHIQKNLVEGDGLSEEEKTEIGMRAGEFSLTAVPEVESRNLLVVFRQVSADLIVFICARKEEALLDPYEKTLKGIFTVIKWFLLIVFFIYCAGLRFNSFALSIQQKLLLLFLFSNGLPLLILVSTGYEFFEQKKQTMVNALNNQSARFLKDFDNRFPSYVADLSVRLNSFIASESAILADLPDRNTIKGIEAFIADLRPDESYLFSKDGKQLLYFGSDVVTSAGFLKDFFKNTIEIFNYSGFETIPRKKTSLELIADDTSLFSGFLESNDRIFLQNFGSGNRFTYVRLMGDRKNYRSWGVLLVAWKPETLMKRFFKEKIGAVNRLISPRKLILMEADSESIFPPEFAGERNVRRIMHRTRARKMIVEPNFSVGRKLFTASSITGMELTDVVLLSLVPLDSVNAALDDLYFQVQMAFLASMVFMLTIVRLYSGRFSQPVQLLAKGVREIRKRNFKYQVDYQSQDEFGQLIKGFNDAVVGMGELAVGTAVQESLLPEGQANIGKSRLFARSIFMNRMGGDYFDYYSGNNGKLHVFFGDVAGHGIPAAMIMAMAKAVVAVNRNLVDRPGEMLERANSIFLHLKSKGWRRMMTALCLEIDNESGELRCANAGQCFPVVVSDHGCDLRYIRAVGMPLGNILKKGYKETADRLSPGETLVLYTDGIIEATDVHGNVFDFARFEELLKNAWHEDLETYWQGVIAAYRAWSPVQDDDVTFLMVRYER